MEHKCGHPSLNSTIVQTSKDNMGLTAPFLSTVTVIISKHAKMAKMTDYSGGRISVLQKRVPEEFPPFRKIFTPASYSSTCV